MSKLLSPQHYQHLLSLLSYLASYTPLEIKYYNTAIKRLKKISEDITFKQINKYFSKDFRLFYKTKPVS
ncbi:phage integrase SAM-like domain-containing protein [bacterium]|nr:phage integrase SAM-like domain-containing protein [bacterium]MBU1994286.1 phage integrase SAM-like domain-containing protein [bacterium]